MGDVEPIRWAWASETQQRAFNWPRDRKLLLVGGEGSGKTIVNCRRIIKYHLDYPGSRVLIVRRTYKHLSLTVMATFLQECPSAYIMKRPSHDDSRCILRNGSETLFIHLETEASAGMLRSLEINGIYFEEALEIEERRFDAAVRRVGRWANVRMPPVPDTWRWRTKDGRPLPEPMVLLSTNPGDDEGHWIFRRWYEESPERHERRFPEIGPDGFHTGRMLSFAEAGYDKIEMPSHENRFLSATTLGELYALGDTDRTVEGRWGQRGDKIHTVHHDSLVAGSQELLDFVRARCSLARILDHGVSAASCVLWAGEDSDSNIYFYREHYQPNPLISEHRKAIWGMSQGETYAENLADPSIKSMVMGKGGVRWSVQQEYSDRGLYDGRTAIAWNLADNDEYGTRNRINEYLHWDPEHRNPFTGAMGAPRMYFLTRAPGYDQGLVHAHVQLQAQRRERLPDGILTNVRDKSVTDHGYDCCRYYVAGRQPIRAANPRYPKNSVGWELQRRIRDEHAQDGQYNVYG